MSEAPSTKPVTVALAFDTSKLVAQLNRAKVDFIAAGHGFDVHEVRPQVVFEVVDDKPDVITIQPRLLGFPE